jgi:phenylpropionate dioxygenase-like ring-hydroxylating dioxygenase large terminal subunit
MPTVIDIKPADSSSGASVAASIINRKILAEPMAPGGFADHATPLVRDCWYVAGLGGEITREITSKRFLGVEVAMYRTLAGEPVAVKNRCPHRSMPLSKGKLIGDVLMCGYHGMQFDPSGRCLNMPSMPVVPTNANVRSFPMVERGPLVWIWMGNPDKADEALVPDTHWLSDPKWASVTGSFPLKCDYVSMHENLLDQTHFPFLHPGTVGTPEYARSELDVKMEGEVVRIDRLLRNSPPPGIYSVPAEIVGKMVDRYSEARFASPAMHTAFARIVDPQPAPGKLGEFRFNITHLVTPETNDSIHYWWFNSRDFKLHDAEADTYMYEMSTKAYLEDVDALEAILQVVKTDEEPQFDLNFGPDKPGLLMRRTLYNRVAAEAGFVF